MKRRPADGFLNFLSRLRFVVNISGKIVLRKKERENASLFRDTLGKCAYILLVTFLSSPKKAKRYWGRSFGKRSLGPFPIVPPDVFISCAKMKNPREKLTASGKQGEALGQLPASCRQLSGI
jgi:hypothetical protein